MFERFTDRARRAIVVAQEEARALNHGHIGPEHILLGIIDEDEGIAVDALKALGVGIEALRANVEAVIGQGRREPSGRIPFTPRAKKALELALREALQLGHNYIGSEHILLGLLREGQNIAAQILIQSSAELNRVRAEVARLVAERGPDTDTVPSRATSEFVRLRPAEIVARLNALDERLARIERHLGIDAGGGNDQADASPGGEPLRTESWDVEPEQSESWNVEPEQSESWKAESDQSGSG